MTDVEFIEAYRRMTLIAAIRDPRRQRRAIEAYNRSVIEEHENALKPRPVPTGPAQNCCPDTAVLGLELRFGN